MIFTLGSSLLRHAANAAASRPHTQLPFGEGLAGLPAGTTHLYKAYAMKIHCNNSVYTARTAWTYIMHLAHMNIHVAPLLLTMLLRSMSTNQFHDDKGNKGV